MNDAATGDDVSMQGLANQIAKYLATASILVSGAPVVLMKAIPQYDDQRPLLTGASVLFCLLIVAFVFYSRDRLGPAWAKGSPVARWLPLALFVGALGSLVAYLRFLHKSAIAAKGTSVLVGISIDQTHATPTWLREHLTASQIPYEYELVVSYVLVFVLAEASLAVMVLREYRKVSLRELPSLARRRRRNFC